MAFGDVHMLSHLVGAANRADIRRLAALEAEKAELALKVDKQQAQLREAIVTRDATIRRLNDVLAERVARDRSVGSSPRPQEHADELAALCELVAQLHRHLSTAARQRERAEQRYEMVCVALSEANAALRDANVHAQHLGEELAAAGMQLATTQGADDV